MDIIWFVWPFVTAIANRIRGGWFGDHIREVFPFWGTTVARLFFSFIMTFPLLFAIETSLWWHTALIIFGFFVTFYLGLIFRWSPWQYMPLPYRDIIALTFRGLLLTGPAGFVIDSTMFMVSGMSMGIIYYISSLLNWDYVDGEGSHWEGSDWAEVFFGFFLGLMLILSLNNLG